MPYPIHLSNGTQLTTIADGAIDSSSTSLVLLGRNFAGYGGYLAQDFVHTLENFANTTAPANPLTGQLWFDLNAPATLRVWLNNAWIAAGVPADNTLNSVTFKKYIDIINDSATANDKRWRLVVADDGSFNIEAINDDGTVRDTPLSLHADGTLWASHSPATNNSSLRLATTAWVKALHYITGDNNGLLTQQMITDALGFTPVQQGGGTSQGNNKIRIGWDGHRLRLQVDATDENEMAFLSDINWGQITGKPAFADAATTTVADIRAGVDLNSRVKKAGDNMTGNLVFAPGNVVYVDHIRFISDPGNNTGISWVGGSDHNDQVWLVTGGNYSHSFTPDGRIWTSYYHYLDEYFTNQTWVQSQGFLTASSLNGYARTSDVNATVNNAMDSRLSDYATRDWVIQNFAARAPLGGMGGTNTFGSGGGSGGTPVPIATGYELLESNGQHQVRPWVQNCTDCNCFSNCNDCAGTCFPPWALVTMADGQQKPIAEMRVGDLVMGRYGEANEVLAKEYPLLGNRPMFLVNGEHWTTDEHPHLIQEGFSAIIPANYARVDVGGWFEVELADGSREVWQNVGLPDEPFAKFEVGVLACYRQNYRMVETIEAHHWSPDFVLYNLVLGGSHTYHVDHYCVTGWPQSIDFDYRSWQPTGRAHHIPKRGLS